MKRETAYRNALESFDLEDLDSFEEFQYLAFAKNMSKNEALEIIINTVEGDWSQLSPLLADIAEEYVKL